MRIAVVSLCLFLVACGSRAPRGMWADPSLDSRSLAEGIVIGGVTDLTTDRDVYEMQQDAALLEAELRAARPSVTIAAWSEARSLVEPDSLDAILASYRLSGRLTASQMSALAPLAARGRYLALSRIDLDQTVNDYIRRVREMSDRTVVELDPESRRKISLILDLYDLQTSRLVYTMQMERTAIEHGSVSTVEGVDAVPTETEIRNAIDDLESGSDRPEPADRGNLLASIFREVVKHLP